MLGNSEIIKLHGKMRFENIPFYTKPRIGVELSRQLSSGIVKGAIICDLYEQGKCVFAKFVPKETRYFRVKLTCKVCA